MSKNYPCHFCGDTLLKNDRGKFGYSWYCPNSEKHSRDATGCLFCGSNQITTGSSGHMGSTSSTVCLNDACPLKVG